VLTDFMDMIENLWIPNSSIKTPAGKKKEKRFYRMGEGASNYLEGILETYLSFPLISVVSDWTYII
jgi:hypothetical protein